MYVLKCIMELCSHNIKEFICCDNIVDFSTICVGIRMCFEPINFIKNLSCVLYVAIPT